jgi:hypothetical protein
MPIKKLFTRVLDLILSVSKLSRWSKDRKESVENLNPRLMDVVLIILITIIIFLTATYLEQQP